MKLCKHHFVDACHVKAIFYDCIHENIIDDILKYYQDKDELIYLKLRKAQLKGSFDTFIKLMEKNGDANILKILHNKCDVSDETQLEVDRYDKHHIVILDDDFNNDDLYKYNKKLDMYVNISSKVFVKPDNSCAFEMIFFKYIKVICIV